ncbi:MAG: hypothetical protein M3O36_00530 [Myxococcota bacterium]|nr:hypothetical protein [Myxococcota bacterium]
MRTLLTCTAVASLFVVFGACKKQDETPAAAPPAPSAAYPQQGYPGVPQQGAYGQYPSQPAPTAVYPAPAPTPTYGQYPAPQPTAQPAPASSGQMAVPGPVAFQCQNDVPCGTHHCNLQYGKCAFPCQSAIDCLAPNQCMGGFCVPAMPH